MSAANSQAGFSLHNNRRSTIGETEFDFDQRLVKTVPYRRAMASLPPINTNQDIRKIRYGQKKSPEWATNQHDEGYHSMGNSHTGTPTTPLSGNPPFGLVPGIRSPLHQEYSSVEVRDIFKIRSRSSNNSPNSPHEATTRHWLSPSSSSSPLSPKSPSSPINKFSDPRKKKFWPGLGRLNISSTPNLKPRSSKIQLTSPTYGLRQRRVRSQDANLTQSIDLGTTDGLEVPALVRAAQAGSRIEVERLIDNGHDIEAFHGPTRRTALAVAAHCGNSEIVAALVHLNANCRSQDHTLATPLHLAASRGHIGVLEILLEEGVPLEEADDKKATALWIAVHSGHFEAAELLLQKGANVNARAEGQLAPLHITAQRGDAEIAELLLRHNAHIESRDSYFMTALHYACAKGHQAVVDILLDQGASMEAMGNDGRSPLICAATEGHRHIVELLLKRKASPRSKDERENNALHWAAFYGHVDVVDLLLRKKLSINDKNADGLSPLHLAVVGSQFSAVEFLLRMNAMLEPQCRQGRSPMHYACGSDNGDIVRLLLSAGAQAEAPVAGNLRRPIHIAASAGNGEIIQLLCEKGVAIDSRDLAGNRPLYIAAYHGHIAVVEKLLDFKAIPYLPFGDRSYEDSPLCVAAKQGHLSVVSVLLKRGASIRQKDEHGWSPIQYAAHYGHPEVLELLLTQASTESDDVTETSAFDNAREYVIFDTGLNISEERRARVRELLFQAENQSNAYVTEGILPSTRSRSLDQCGSQAAELDIDFSSRTQAVASDSQEKDVPITNNDELSYGMPAFFPRQPDPRASRHQPLSPKPINDISIDSFMSSPSSAAVTRNMHIISPAPLTCYTPGASNADCNRPRRPLSSANMTPMAQLSPEEVAKLIEDRRKEISQLQLFLPSINEDRVYDVGGFHTTASVAYEVPS
jgi:ankyrin repeat protein